MDVKKIAAGAVIPVHSGCPPFRWESESESESARRPRTLGRAGHQTATATATGETVIRDDRISGKGTSGPDQWRPDQGGWDQRRWDQRGIDDARFDHQPFNWQGQQVEPYWDQDRGAWGVWFFGAWIPL